MTASTSLCAEQLNELLDCSNWTRRATQKCASYTAIVFTVHAYPLTAPAAIPLMMYFWSER